MGGLSPSMNNNNNKINIDFPKNQKINEQCLNNYKYTTDYYNRKVQDNFAILTTIIQHDISANACSELLNKECCNSRSSKISCDFRNRQKVEIGYVSNISSSMNKEDNLSNSQRFPIKVTTMMTNHGTEILTSVNSNNNDHDNDHQKHNLLLDNNNIDNNNHQQQSETKKLNTKLKPVNSFHNKAKKLLNLSPAPLRPSSSISCLFSASHSEDAADSTSSLASMPTRASLTHEWKKLKTPNKCRECNLLVYFNGRECSFCGFVAHKKCATILVIKCSGQRVTCFKSQSTDNQSTSQTNTPPPTTSHHLSWSRKRSEKKNNNAQNQNSNNNKDKDKRSHHSSNDTPSAPEVVSKTKTAPLCSGGSNQNSSSNPQHKQSSSGSCYTTTNYYKQPTVQPIYGQPILIDSHQIVDFIRRFVYEIDSRGLTSKGIYRVSSIKSKVDKLCNYYDQNLSSLVDLSSFHPNIIANAFKMYLRQLPEPLLTDSLYRKFIEFAKKYPIDKTVAINGGKSDDILQEKSIYNNNLRFKLYTPPPPATTIPSTNLSFKNQQSQLGCSTSKSMIDLNNTSVLSPIYDPLMIVELKEILDLLPPINRELVAIIMRHLKRVADMSESNQMSAKNLSIIFGPTLLNTRDKSVAIVDSIHQARVVELMISWAEQIFPLYSNYESNAVIELNISAEKTARRNDNRDQHLDQAKSKSAAASSDETLSMINHVDDSSNKNVTQMIIYVDVPKVDITLCDGDETTICDEDEHSKCDPIIRK